VLSIQKQVIWK